MSEPAALLEQTPSAIPGGNADLKMNGGNPLDSLKDMMNGGNPLDSAKNLIGGRRRKSGKRAKKSASRKNRSSKRKSSKKGKR